MGYHSRYTSLLPNFEEVPYLPIGLRHIKNNYPWGFLPPSKSRVFEGGKQVMVVLYLLKVVRDFLFFRGLLCVMRTFWDRPHRPIGRPNLPNWQFFDEKCKYYEKMIPNQVFIKWPNMAEIFHKNFWWIFQHYCFQKKFFFEKSCSTSKILVLGKICPNFAHFS